MSFSTALWTILYIASEWIIRIIMILVVPFRRTADAARSWLLLVFFLPWPALLLYLFIGRPVFPKWRQERFKRIPEVIALSSNQIRSITEAAEITEASHVIPYLNEAARFVQNIGLLPMVGNSDVELLQDYQMVIDRLIADIDQAQEHVHLLFYIFANDETGQKVIHALKRAVSRGVACRVLIDDVGSRKWIKDIFAELKPAGVEVHRALPVSFLRRHSARADLRNHYKIAVIDSTIGYVGSQNIINADFAPGILNQELMTRMTGPIVLELQTLFIVNWFLETEEELSAKELLKPTEKTGHVICQVFPSGPDFTQFGMEHLLITLLHAARDQVVITTPYFIPSESLITAMQIAVLRGVEVHLIVSEVTDHQLVKWAQCSYYSDMMEIGIKIHAYQNKLLHAKHFSIDDYIAVVGSSNVDMRSFVLNSEVMALYYDRDVVKRLHAIQDEYFSNSIVLNLDEWNKRPGLTKIWENLARMVGPVL